MPKSDEHHFMEQTFDTEFGGQTFEWGRRFAAPCPPPPEPPGDGYVLVSHHCRLLIIFSPTAATRR